MLSITDIKTSRIKNRVNLIFSDKTYLPFFIDDVVRLSLIRHQELNLEKINQIKSLSLLYLGKEYALRQVAISPKTEKILSQKLKVFFLKITQKFKLLSCLSYDLMINQIVDNLKEKKLIDQSNYISYFLKKNKSKSALEIKFLLKQKGIDVSSINIPIKNEISSIKKILLKKNINKELMADFNYKNKLYSSFFRKGFSFSNIKTAIDEYLALQ